MAFKIRMEIAAMNKKETTVKEWVTAFQSGTSFWKNSVHVDELLGKKQKGEVYFSKSFDLFAELINRASEVELTKDCYLSLYFYLKPSSTLDIATPNISDLWNDFSHTPPELYLIEKNCGTERGAVELYEKPILLSEMDKANLLGSWPNIYAYYTCWRSNDNEDGDTSEYERAVVIEYHQNR